MRLTIPMALLVVVSGCAGAPQPQTIRVEVSPSDAVCEIRQGGTVTPLVAPDRRATLQVLPMEIEVQCHRNGYETATVRKSPMHYSTAPTAGPLLLLLDPRSSKTDTYPPVIRVALERE